MPKAAWVTIREGQDQKLRFREQQGGDLNFFTRRQMLLAERSAVRYAPNIEQGNDR